MTDADHYHRALMRIAKAVRTPGRRPDYHRIVMARHRREWPTLWKAIDMALQDLDAPRRDPDRCKDALRDLLEHGDQPWVWQAARRTLEEA